LEHILDCRRIFVVLFSASELSKKALVSIKAQEDRPVTARLLESFGIGRFPRWEQAAKPIDDKWTRIASKVQVQLEEHYGNERFHRAFECLQASPQPP
jgi:hypothetical protein